MAYFILKTSETDPGAKYEVPTTLTYGEQIDVFKEFGQDAAALGVIWIAVRRQFPNTSVADLREASVEMFEDDEDKLPPTNGAAPNYAAANEPRTEPLNTGSPGSESTTE